jgi:hypothetical protein
MNYPYQRDSTAIRLITKAHPFISGDGKAVRRCRESLGNINRMTPAEQGGRFARDSLEPLAEIIAMGKTGFFGNRFPGFVGVHQPMGGFSNAIHNDKLPDRT